jgi:hypothetical protein
MHVTYGIFQIIFTKTFIKEGRRNISLALSKPQTSPPQSLLVNLAMEPEVYRNMTNVGRKTTLPSHIPVSEQAQNQLAPNETMAPQPPSSRDQSIYPIDIDVGVSKHDDDMIGSRSHVEAKRGVETSPNDTMVSSYPNPSLSLPHPSLSLDFRMSVTLNPKISLGSTPFGHRNWISFTGGAWSGPWGSGVVLVCHPNVAQNLLLTSLAWWPR